MEAPHTLNQIVEAVRALSPEEQAQLRALLNDARAGMTEEVFAERMVDLGLLERRRPPFPSTADDFQPVLVRGKSTSAVIIEERR